MSDKLTDDLKLAVRMALAPLADGFFSRAEELERNRFISFLPLLEFEASFCAPSELPEHRRYLVEQYKELVGNLPGYTYLATIPRPGYRSPLLSELRRARDEAGYTFESRDPGRPWLIELDPCRRELRRLRFCEPRQYEVRRQPFISRHRQLRREETQLYSTSKSRRFAKDRSEALSFYSVVMEPELAPLGFKPDQMLSTRAYPVFSKHLGPGWTLSWHVASPHLVRTAGSEGAVYLYLLLSDSVVRGDPDKAAAQAALLVPYNYMAPVDPRDWNYRTFQTLDEMEVILKVNVFAYRLVQHEIESILAERLRGESVGA